MILIILFQCLFSYHLQTFKHARRINRLYVYIYTHRGGWYIDTYYWYITQKYLPPILLPCHVWKTNGLPSRTWPSPSFLKQRRKRLDRTNNVPPALLDGSQELHVIEAKTQFQALGISKAHMLPRRWGHGVPSARGSNRICNIPDYILDGSSHLVSGL